MRRLLLLALVALVIPAPVVAQSRVTEIYAEMARNAARAAEARAAIRNQMIADLFALPVAILEQRPIVVVPPVLAPVETFEMRQKYLEEAFAYHKELDRARRALFAVTAPAAAIEPEAAPIAIEPEALPVLMLAASDCGVTPVKPVPPVGCKDLVAQCVTDGKGHSSWQWVCVK